MWPFGKKKIDVDALGMELLRESAKYLKPTVDGLYRYLDESGQLQYRDEMTEKRILNLAGAVAVVELVLFQTLAANGGRNAMAKHDLLDGFYGAVQQLVDQSFAEQRLRIDEGKALIMRLVHEAVAEYPNPAREPQEESLAYEMARATIRLHMQWASGNGDHVALPTGQQNWRELSEAGDGLARSQRWIEQSLGKQIRKALA